MPAAAEALRADGLICTRIENGAVQTNCRGAEKVRRIRAWAEEQPEAVDFARSRAYGDTAGDLPMLRLVGEGFAVNPKRKLRRAANAVGAKYSKGFEDLYMQETEDTIRAGRLCCVEITIDHMTGKIGKELLKERRRDRAGED